MRAVNILVGACNRAERQAAEGYLDHPPLQNGRRKDTERAPGGKRGCADVRCGRARKRDRRGVGRPRGLIIINDGFGNSR